MAYIYDLSDTWNASGTTFFGIKMNVTNTASASGSKLLSLQVASTEYFGVDKSGNVRIGNGGDLAISSATGGDDTVIYNDAENFFVAVNGTPQLHVSSAGNFGVGNTNPGTKFDVTGNIRLSAANPVIELNNGGAKVYSTVANTLQFATGGGIGTPVERARFNSSGKMLIGATAVTSADVTGLLQVQSEIISRGSLAGMFWENRSGGTTATSNWYGWYTSTGTIFLYNGSANIASINSTTGAYTALSDAAHKKDFEPSDIGLNAILALKPTLFRMKTDEDDAPKQLGFIAQEVKDYIPQAYVEQQNVDATGNEAVYIGLNDRPIVAALVKAVQELTARVAELEDK